MTPYPRRLIEVDLPIKKISEHSRREKSIRHGHISTLHIWWARRPLAACRAVICAALWVDPADPLCPEKFRRDAAALMKRFFDPMGTDGKDFNDPMVLRGALLDFIADFANWDNSTKKEYLETSRTLTQSAHESLGGAPGTRPLVVDPFSGSGSIPLEALRVGADAYASDLNPVAVLLNKVILEYIPKYGQRLADEVRKWGEWIKQEAEKELSEFYPKDPDGATPIAYLWARTITCEGPGCGAEVPLMRSLWLAKKGSRSVALRVVPKPEEKRVDFEIIQNVQAKDMCEGTMRRSSVTCPVCGFTTQAENVKKQLFQRKSGANDARLITIVTTKSNRPGRFFRLPTDLDLKAFEASKREFERREKENNGKFSLSPDEILPYLRSIFNINLLGVNQWGELFTYRQLLSLSTFVSLIKRATNEMQKSENNELAAACASCLALTLSKLADLANSLCTWEPNVVTVQHLFTRQAMGIVWDFAEGNPIGDSRGSWGVYCENNIDIISAYSNLWHIGHVLQVSASEHPLPDDAANLFVTDPPYYDAVPYADLSDFFYVWLKRLLSDIHPDLFGEKLTPKEKEIVQLAERNPIYAYKTKENFEALMTTAMKEGRRILNPYGIGVVVFAHKTTTGWETQLQAMIAAGWVVVASWPIDTELATRLRGMNSAALASSIHLVCRPRAPGSESAIGDWRDVLQELPVRIHEWMPRLAQEGVVGADAIFACLGPALEIFSRYSRVEKASGEIVPLKEYLEYVWAAVAKEALAMIFQGADATGFEEDARLTAMWLWTLSTGVNGNGNKKIESEIEYDEDAESSGKSPKISGFVLEYDAARKIAQGLGAHLEHLTKLVEIKGDKARLLPVEERTAYLFGKEDIRAPKRKKKEARQLTLTGVLDEAEEEAGGWGEMKAPPAGTTVLDRVHQAMILFAAGRSDALKRFLVEDGIGKDERFWRLAQAFSALYPAGTDEKRWVEGLMARKKGLGF
jgi:putative DNA methylase